MSTLLHWSRIDLLLCFAGEEMGTETEAYCEAHVSSQAPPAGSPPLQRSSGFETGRGVGSGGNVGSAAAPPLRWEKSLNVCQQRLSLLRTFQWWSVSRCLRHCQTGHLCLSAEHLVVSENRCGPVEQSVATIFFFLNVALTLAAFTNFPNVTQPPSGPNCLSHW